jgi:hypothetical protein
MTQEEKAKAYDEALKRIENLENTTSEEEAVINYIFPQLHESEDERIIRFFAELATNACGGAGQEYYEELGLNYDKVMTWLEKQKEQKPESCDCSRDEESYTNGIHHVLMNPEAYGLIKQKPAEWSEDTIRKAIEEVGLTQHQINWFKNNVFPPKQEWSEEDKVMLNNIIWSVHMKSIIKPLYEIDDRSRYKKYEDFLKALPERFNLQPRTEWSKEEKERIRQSGRLDVCYNPEKYGLCHKTEWGDGEMKALDSIINDYELAAKSFCGHDGKIMFLKAIRDGEYGLSKQEWSEEDEKTFNSIFNDFKQDVIPDKEDQEWLKNRLKSLRPQPHWKPSEEQMKALFAASERNDKLGAILNNLYNGLKKL